MIDSFNRRAAGPVPPTAGAAMPDAAFAARPRLAHLRDALVRTTRARPPRWGEAAIFFFDPKRQAELDAARQPSPDPLAELTALIAAELLALVASVEVRRVARATDGLRAAADLLAPRLPAARDLAELLAIPDDEVFLALAPLDRVGVRLHVRGAASVADLHRLLAPALGLAQSQFQLLAPAAVRPDGTLPSGFAACEHWLWPTQPLCAVPRLGGSRVVMVGPAAVRPALDIDPRFPGLAAECEAIQTLTAVQTAEAVAKVCGASLPVAAPIGGFVARAA